MPDGRARYYFKVMLVMLVIIACLGLIGTSIDATTSRFGNIGWLHWIVGFFVFVAGVVVAGATVMTGVDRRALRLYKADPDGNFSDGQTVVLSGRVLARGEPALAPFSGTACAAYSYEVTGQRSVNTDGSNHYRQQLCLLGYRLADAALDCGSRHFPLAAMAEVDTALSTSATGGDWGAMAMEKIRSSAATLTQIGEPVARGRLSDARAGPLGAREEHCFVASTTTTDQQLSVTEDIIPLDAPVTILACFDAAGGSLTGRRTGGMKVFPGLFDECLAEQDKVWHKGVKVGLPLLFIGAGILTLPWWLPGG